MTHVLEQYKAIIESTYKKIEQRTPLSQEEKFAYYEAVHYVALHNFHLSESRPIEERKRLYALVDDSHKKLHKIERRILGDSFRDFGIQDPLRDLENRRIYIRGFAQPGN
jgi:hypothetical protein